MLGLLSNADNPTPMVRLNKVVPFKHTRVYAKLEWYNPFGAVKDRVAANMVSEAEEQGILDENQKLVEPTSGNTGMGLAMVSNLRGYNLTTPLSKLIPQEKRTVLKLFGSNVIELDDELCPAPGAPEGAIAMANGMAEQPDFHMLNQYMNEANPNAHMKTTGPEIWRQTDGEITHFFAGLGTCGTITGNGRFLKGKNPNIQVIGIHPAAGHDIPGVRSLPQLGQTALFKPDEYDGLVEVANQEAYDMALRLNREESIIAGPSSAMALVGALRSLPDEPGNIAVIIFPDNIFKYASSVVKYIPELNIGSQISRKEEFLATMVENTRANSHLTIPNDQAHAEWQQNKPTVIDVRGFARYDQQHVPGAINMPLLDMADYEGMLPQNKDERVLVICQRGNLSLSGTLYLTSLGYTDVVSVDGGTSVWAASGFPVDENPA